MFAEESVQRGDMRGRKGVSLVRRVLRSGRCEKCPNLGHNSPRANVSDVQAEKRHALADESTELR